MNMDVFSFCRLILNLSNYRNHQGLDKLRGRLCKRSRSQIPIAQGCEDADVCEATD